MVTDDDHDRHSGVVVDMEGGGGKEALHGDTGSTLVDDIQDRLDPVDDLKARLSMWGESRHYQSDGDEDEEEGSEYELLLDPNLPHRFDATLGDFDRGSGSFDSEHALKGPGEDGAHDEEGENSAYPEVRAAVHNYDEDLPCNTIRAWTIGLSLVVLGASMNTLFSLRSPSISLGPLVAQVIAWPIGHGWAKIMPTKKFRTFGIPWSLNPGPFNIKEHSIVVVMASVSFSVAYATDIILAQVVFYKQNFGTAFQLMLTVSTQSLGYGIAGMMRKFLGKQKRRSVPSSPWPAC